MGKAQLGEIVHRFVHSFFGGMEQMEAAHNILDFDFSGDGLGGLHRVADAGVGPAGEDHKAFFAVKDQGGVVQQLVLFQIPI